jgi:hypothetical protein
MCHLPYGLRSKTDPPKGLSPIPDRLECTPDRPIGQSKTYVKADGEHLHFFALSSAV